MKKSVGGIWVNYWLLKISMKTDKTGKTEDNTWHLMLNVTCFWHVLVVYLSVCTCHCERAQMLKCCKLHWSMPETMGGRRRSRSDMNRITPTKNPNSAVYIHRWVMLWRGIARCNSKVKPESRIYREQRTFRSFDLVGHLRRSRCWHRGASGVTQNTMTGWDSENYGHVVILMYGRRCSS